MRAPLAGALLALAAALPAARAQGRNDPRTLTELDRLARIEQVKDLPPADSVTSGPRIVAAGTVVHGTIVARGPIEVLGRVEGSAVSLAGDVVVRPGGTVTGDVIAVGGHVTPEGTVGGEMRSMAALPTILPTATAAAVPLTAAQRTLQAVRLVAGTFGVLLVIAIGVLLFASRNLDEVVSTLETKFGRAFLFGLMGQLLVLPGLLVLVVALAVSIIGILLIPFAIVAYAIGMAGLVTLGFLAVARVIGGGIAPRAGSDRSRALVGLVAGVGLFFALWMSAALLVSLPLAATVLRAAALAATWAAATLGLGGAILSRAGTHRRVASGARPVELASWQTPTPISGVVAATRRPVASREAL